MLTSFKANSIRSFIKRFLVSTFGFTLVLGFYATIQTSVLGSRFGANDDFGMSQIANGGYTGKPSEYLLFINIILGHVLKLCYQLIPGIQWYPLLQVVSMSIAFAVFMRSVVFTLRTAIPQERTLRGMYSLTLFFVVFTQFIVWVYSINFSTTAYFCSILGLLSLLLSLRAGQTSIAIIPIFVCLLGYLWRSHAFFSVVPIFSIILVFQFRQIPYKSLFKNVSVMAILILIMNFTNQLAYTTSSKWHDFYDYNFLRGKIHGNFVFDTLIEKYDLSNISNRMQIPSINLKLFGQWFYSNTTTTSESLRRAIQLIDENTIISDLRLSQIALSQATGILLVIAPLTILAIVFVSRRYFLLILSILCILAYLIFAESYIGQFIRLPSYITEGLRFSAILSLFMLLFVSLITGLRDHFLKFYLHQLLPFVLLPLVFYGGHLIWETTDLSSESKNYQAQFLADEKEFKKEFPFALIDSSGLFDPTISSPWSSLKLTSLHVIPFGWGMSSPHQADRLEYLGVSRTLDGAIINGELPVLAFKDSTFLNDISNYLFANYDICGNWDSTPKRYLEQPLMLFRFRTMDVCVSSMYSDPQLPLNEIFYTNDEIHLEISTCMDGITENQISFNAHSPFGSYAKNFRIKINYLGPFMAPTARYVTVKPGGPQPLTVKTWGCDVQITSLSAPVVPFEVNPKIPDRRTLFVGISDFATLDK